MKIIYNKLRYCITIPWISKLSYSLKTDFYLVDSKVIPSVFICLKKTPHLQEISDGLNTKLNMEMEIEWNIKW